jgi:hypothetical protein
VIQVITFHFSESSFEALDKNNSSYQKLLEENRALYSQVQDLKGD